MPTNSWRHIEEGHQQYGLRARRSVIKTDDGEELDWEKVEFLRQLARMGLDKAGRMVKAFYAPAPTAADFLEKGEECYAKSEYGKALEFAIKCGDELKRIRDS